MSGGTLAIVLDSLDRILDRGERAELVLERAFKAHRGLASAERAEVARRVLGTVCLRARLDWIAGRRRAAANPWRLAAYLLDAERLPPSAAAEYTGLAEADLAPLAREPEWPADPVERLAAKRSLPSWLAALWTEQLGETEADALAAAMNAPGPLVVRANALKASRDGLIRALEEERVEARPTRWSPWGVELLGRPNVFGSRAWRAGLFEVQDEGSQLIALLTAARPGERCIDFCAGAGGKTLALAAAMENRGELLALDVDAQRLSQLPPRLRRAGVTIVRSEEVGESRVEPADRVLVDAPCSSLGTLRRSPDARWRIDPSEVRAFPGLQLRILEQASRCLRAGGRLVYATCTVNRGENEEVAAAFSRTHPEFGPLAAEAALGAELASRLACPRELRLSPDRHGTDGFFAAAWTRAR